MEMGIEYSPIGYVRSPFKEPSGIPIQNRGGRGIGGKVEILDEFAEGLSDLDGFSHIILITHLHKSEGYNLRVIPFLDDVERGVFSTRAPRRPNPIGLHIVRLDRIENNIIHIKDIDMLDGTPVLDIKPYFPMVREEEEIRIGWVEGKIERFDSEESDKRFS
jgi:tRNA-Thr(GGU) m(6)t(6)A37 methyltransferase TsaA